MRIVVIDIAASDGGGMTVLKSFYRAVNSYPEKHEWIFFLDQPHFPDTDRVHVVTFPDVKANRFKRLTFDFLYGRKVLDEYKPDVVISMQNTRCFGAKCPQLLFVHQPVPFQSIKRFSLLKPRERSSAIDQHFIGPIIRLSTLFADKVIVQTEMMKRDVLSRCRIPAERIRVILPSVTPFSNKTGRTFSPTQFFYPTNPLSYKNFELIEQAAAILEKEGRRFDIDITTDETYHAGSMHAIGRISHEEVEQRYFGATLLFPSYIESYGYPLGEARHAGTMILASDCPFCREVLNGYPNVRYFNYNEPEALADAMRKVMDGEIEKVDCPAPPEKNAWYSVIREILTTSKACPAKLDRKSHGKADI